MHDFELDQALAKLPRSIVPKRDLWPRLRAQHVDRRGLRTAWAMAAALVLAVGLIRSGLLVPLAPAGQLVVNQGLSDLRSAETELRVAIRSQPANATLNQLLANVVRQRVKLKLQAHNYS